MTLDAQLEAALYAAGKPIAIKRLAGWLEIEPDEVKKSLEALGERLNDRGILLIVHNNEAELVTHPEAAELVRKVLKEETHGELTRPSLEALAVLAYRGPMTRPELEQIRGVQSALILRNLMLRGLVEMREDVRLGQPVYAVTMDFLKHMGMKDVNSLPNFEELHAHAGVERMLDELKPREEGEKTETSLEV